MSDDEKCASCGHAKNRHMPSVRGVGMGICVVCPCDRFSERIDPTPPDGRGWDDSDDQGDPGAS